MKTFIASFQAIDSRRNTLTIVISQELTVNEDNVVVGARQHYNLVDIDGERVLATDEPDTFLMQDGTLLKKTGKLQFSNL